MGATKMFLYITFLVLLLSVTCFARPMTQSQEQQFYIRQLLDFLFVQKRDDGSYGQNSGGPVASVD
ncbi:unnamed protein product, partial [Rotaria sp. Silwood2]